MSGPVFIAGGSGVVHQDSGPVPESWVVFGFKWTHLRKIVQGKFLTISLDTWRIPRASYKSGSNPEISGRTSEACSFFNRRGSTCPTRPEGPRYEPRLLLPACLIASFIRDGNGLNACTKHHFDGIWRRLKHPGGLHQDGAERFTRGHEREAGKACYRVRESFGRPMGLDFTP